jgi:hypothetical protein
VSDTLKAQISSAITAGDAEEILALGLLLEQTVPRTLPGLDASACWYARQGLRVFPVQTGGKIPYSGSRGCKDATTDEQQIRVWWDAYPDANIGIATGHLVDVIDVDGPQGVKSWATIVEDLPPILGQVSTPRPGGNHLYVTCTGERNGAAILPGIDYRGAGGYVVAPPSVNQLGRYVWYKPLLVPVGTHYPQAARWMPPAVCEVCGNELNGTDFLLSVLCRDCLNLARGGGA